MKNVISFSVKILFLFYLSLSNEKKYSSASQRQMLYTCKTQRNYIKKINTQGHSSIAFKDLMSVINCNNINKNSK